MYQKYLLKVILFLFIFSIPICGNWLFLSNTGELLPLKDIVEKQLSSDELFLVGLGTRHQGYHYKKELYSNIKPEILIHGSSRVLQFKKDFFSQRMFNSGCSMSSVNEGYAFIREAFAVHKPKILILGIDYWWFNESINNPMDEIQPPVELSHRISLRSYFLPFKWLWQRKITFSDYVNFLSPLKYLKNHYDLGVGVDGLLNRNGFTSDGSYFYTKIITGKEKSLDELFHTNLHLLEINDSRFDKQAHVNEAHFQNLLNMIDFAKQQNIKVVLFIPPLAPTIINRLNDFAMINDLRHKLKAANLTYYDFHDSKFIKATDCEFLDGTHGGDVLYARIVQHIAQHEKDLDAYINHLYVEKVAKRFSNLAMAPRPELTKNPEIDFLHLGCDKSNQFASSQ